MASTANNVGLVSTLVFGVAIPFGSLAVLVLGCGDNRRPAQRGKKKHVQKNLPRRSSKSSKKKKTAEPKRTGKPKQQSLPLESSKKGAKRSVSIHSVKPVLEDVKSQEKIKSSASTSKNSSISGKNCRSKKVIQTHHPEKCSSSEQSQSSQKSSRALSVSVNKRQVLATKPIPVYSSEDAQIVLEPQRLHFECSGGKLNVSLSNKSKLDCFAIKVKCSDNDVYHVNPVYSLLEPGKSVSFNVYRNAAAAKFDKLVFLATKAAQIGSKPEDAFKDRSKNFTQIVLPLVALDEAKAAELISRSRCVCVAAKQKTP